MKYTDEIKQITSRAAFASRIAAVGFFIFINTDAG